LNESGKENSCSVWTRVSTRVPVDHRAPLKVCHHDLFLFFQILDYLLICVQLIYGTNLFIYDTIGPYTFRCHPGHYHITNEDAFQFILGQVKKSKQQLLLDLFCGNGVFGLFAIKNKFITKVVAVDELLVAKEVSSIHLLFS
jgi:hypothetical protein